MTLAALLLAAAGAASGAPDAATLCRGGDAAMPVVVAAGASPRSRAAAKDLANMLGRLCGGRFEVQTGDGARGLAVGTAQEFAALGLAGVFNAAQPERRDQFLLRSHGQGVWLIGASSSGVDNACADLLHRLGYRRYFPGKHWEIVPAARELTLAADAVSSPAFALRHIWYSYGKSDYNRDAFNEWRLRNRLAGGFSLETGHAFDAMRERNRAAFDAHPEYMAKPKWGRDSNKFCLANAGLRRLIVEDALRQLAQDPSRDTVSVEPSDGDGWCQCRKCAVLGSITDRVVLMANEVARALAQRFPGKFAAFYAYNRHSPAPSIEVEPNVIVSVATAYLEPGLSPGPLIEAWKSRGARWIGVREYYGIFQAHRGLPARMRGGSLSYLARTLPRFKEQGARFISAESGEDWGANGLGYYVAARIMWDVSEASRVDEIREEFLENAFGSAKAPMRRFYALIDGARALPKTALPADLVESMYAALGQAAAVNLDAAAGRRIDDLILYTRYAELYAAYEASKIGRQQAFDAVVRHARRMRPRMMVHLRALVEGMPAADEGLTVPADQNESDFTHAEAMALLERRAT